MQQPIDLAKASPLSPWWFLVFRTTLAVYLLIHFLGLIPFGLETFSNQGMIKDALDIPTNQFFPNILSVWDDPWQVTVFLSILCGLCVTLATGIMPRPSALLLWYGFACLFNRNVFINNPGLPYVGFLLLAIALIPSFSPRKQAGPDWPRPLLLYRGAWVLMALGYSISGFHKLGSPSWLDGHALIYLMDNPLARPGMITDILSSLPQIFLQTMTYGVLALELLFAPLCLVKKLRPWVWLAMVLMHGGIMLTVDFVDLTMGMLMIHLFTFDQRWIKPRHTKDGAIVLFDGVCTLCNHAVDMIVREGLDPNLKLASLQGQTSKGLGMGHSDMSSIILYREGHPPLKESAAALYIAENMGGAFGLLTVGRLLPRFLRDGIYQWVARNRYRVFGKKDTCRLPTPEERGRILP